MRGMLGVHLIPAHWGAFEGRTDADWLRDWQPRFVKVVCDDETVPHIAELPAAAKIIVRNYPLSEIGHNRGFKARDMIDLTGELTAAELPLPQTGSLRDALATGPGAFTPIPLFDGVSEKGLNDLPETIGIAHAQTHARTVAWCKTQGVDTTRLLFEGLNEPMYWATEPPELVARYEVARLREAKRLNLPGLVLFNSGVGWPGNGGVQDAPADYNFMRPVVAEMRPVDYIGSHEYCALQGPGQNWKWWMGRFLQCPFDVKLLITECGIDTGVTGQWYGGWGDLPANSWEERARTYVDMLFWYAEQCAKDGRVEAVFPFTWDTSNKIWERFDVRNGPFLHELLQRPDTAPPYKPPAGPPVPVVDPYLAAMQKAFGAKLVDERTTLPKNKTAIYLKRATSAIKRVIYHHTAVDSQTTWAAVAQYHVNSQHWPGIGYHVGVDPDGTVHLLNDLTTISYHAGTCNSDSIGVCVGGNYETEQPTPTAVATAKAVVAALESYLGRPLTKLGHRQVSQTACPGRYLYAELSKDAPKDDATAVLLASGRRAEVINISEPQPALFKAMYADGRWPTAPEFAQTVNGVNYVAQPGRKPGESQATVYYCVVGVWDKVLKAS